MSLRKTAGAYLRILFGSALYCAMASDQGLSAGSVSPALKGAKERSTSADGSGVPSKCAADASSGCRSSTSFEEDEGSMVIFVELTA